MTREEARNELVLWRNRNSNNGYHYKFVEALTIAIEALEQEPCEDAVSRNAIIQTLNNMDRYVANKLILCDTNNKFPQNEVFVVDDVYEKIAEQLPSVTPKPKTGHWIFTKTMFDKHGCTAECSYCHKKWKTYDEIRFKKEHNYCPNCGCRMVEPQESEEEE